MTVTLAAGTLSEQIEGDALSSDFALARAWATGDAAGTNPGGVGGATWTGIVEATATGGCTRLQGNATASIADLSRLRVAVAINVPGHATGVSGRADMSLNAGRYTAGTTGVGDWLAGDFLGSGHEEAWGGFDTTGYIGAFGTKREP